MILAIISAAIGSIGFALTMKVRPKQIFYSGLGAAICWTAYLFFKDISGSVFVATLLAALVVAAFAEISAKINRAPTTIFLIGSGLPLIPGRNLYNMMYGIVSDDFSKVYSNMFAVASIALAIAIGYLIVTLATGQFRKSQKKGEPYDVHERRKRHK
jgi:uncharacterized membrane protein YjjB (DUF3815 family)